MKNGSLVRVNSKKKLLEKYNGVVAVIVGRNYFRGAIKFHYRVKVLKTGRQANIFPVDVEQIGGGGDRRVVSWDTCAFNPYKINS